MTVVYGAAAVMRRSILSALIALVLLTAGSARGDAGDDARARSLYEKGMAHFQLDEYDAAITLWLEAYRFKPVPELLYNVAQAHRLKSERALAFYRKYLALNPQAANRAEVERHIASLEELLRDEPPPKLPTPVAAPKPLPVKLTPPLIEAPKPVVTAAPAALIARAPERSLVKKPWFWATVGTVAVVVAVCVGVGVGERGAADSGASFGVARGN